MSTTPKFSPSNPVLGGRTLFVNASNARSSHPPTAVVVRVKWLYVTLYRFFGRTGSGSSSAVDGRLVVTDGEEARGERRASFLALLLLNRVEEKEGGGGDGLGAGSVVDGGGGIGRIDSF
ncbi:hypothetical protein BT69DRAFT_1279964 [Atractiella rhizophila]|nr:hypothetical protein BT69DRAFT_1279964 [Atractiella rhizophila]